jgi:SAM-dependent methyltransferase
MAAPFPRSTATEAPDVETASDAYARRFAGPVGTWLLAVQTETLRRLLAPWPAASVLDVGGGHAQAAAPLVAWGHPVTVTGSAPSCRARLDRLLPAAAFRFEECPVHALPFPDASFDVVVALRLLAHVGAWRELLGELARVARVAIVLDYPPRRGVHRWADRLFGWKRAVEGDTRPYRSFLPGEIEGELARMGWVASASRGELLLPLAFHRLLRAAPISRLLEATPRRLGVTARRGAPVMLLATRPQPEETGRHSGR